MVDDVHHKSGLTGFFGYGKRFICVANNPEIPVSDRMTIGQRIREAREASGMSQAALGVAVDRRQSTVNDWEHDKATPKPHMMEKIGRALGVSQSWLYGFDEPASSEPVSLDDSRHDDAEIDIDDLAAVMVLIFEERNIGTLTRASRETVRASAASAAGIYQNLSAISNRRGLARVRAAIVPVLSDLLEIHGQPQLSSEETEDVASVIAGAYLLLRRLPKALRRAAP